jgi:hypothetical protein
MNIALGFGSTEQAFVEHEREAIRAEIKRLFAEQGVGYFTDDLATHLREWLSARSKETQAQADRYKAATEYPDRYSYYWPTVLDDANHVVVILSVHHINRRHALSPDGWALMREKPLFLFEAADMPAVQEAA